MLSSMYHVKGPVASPDQCISSSIALYLFSGQIFGAQIRAKQGRGEASCILWYDIITLYCLRCRRTHRVFNEAKRIFSLLFHRYLVKYYVRLAGARIRRDAMTRVRNATHALRYRLTLILLLSGV